MPSSTRRGRGRPDGDDAHRRRLRRSSRGWRSSTAPRAGDDPSPGDPARPPRPGRRLGRARGRGARSARRDGCAVRPPAAAARAWSTVAGSVRGLAGGRKLEHGLPRAVLNLGPFEEAIRGRRDDVGIATFDPALVARPGIELRLAVTALRQRQTHYVTQEGRLVGPDAHTTVLGAQDVDVIDGVIASASVPGVFPPRSLGGDHYVDGGCLQNIPLRAAVDLGATDIYTLVAVPVRPAEAQPVALGRGVARVPVDPGREPGGAVARRGHQHRDPADDRGGGVLRGASRPHADRHPLRAHARRGVHGRSRPRSGSDREDGQRHRHHHAAARVAARAALHRRAPHRPRAPRPTAGAEGLGARSWWRLAPRSASRRPKAPTSGGWAGSCTPHRSRTTSRPSWVEPPTSAERFTHSVTSVATCSGCVRGDQ